MSEAMYGAEGAGQAQTTRSLGGLNPMPVGTARDVGAFGMAANRLRAINRSLDQVITTLRVTQDRISETGAKTTGSPSGSPSIDPPPPSQTLPGLLRELEATEGLIQALHGAIQFMDGL